MNNKFIILFFIGPLLLLNSCLSCYSRRIGNTRFYLVETMANSKDGRPLAGLYYKSPADSGYNGENLPGYPKYILWNEHYVISKNFDGDNPGIVEYVIINTDSIKSDFLEEKDIHRFKDEESYYKYLKQIKLSEEEMEKTDNHITWRIEPF